MLILVFNAGSSSLKFGVFDTQSKPTRIFKGEFENFRNGNCALHTLLSDDIETKKSQILELKNISEAIKKVPSILRENGIESFDAIGHRVAHGGDQFREAVMVDDAVIEQIRACIPLAPLHNPANLAPILLAKEIWPAISQVAVFDTAFHHTIPDYAYTYAVPKSWRDSGLRRYGFHGSSHKYIALRTAQELAWPLSDLRIISCHLGNGASVCAINHGFSVDTSMGMTPLEGLVMGTRSGDVDPGIFSYLERELNLRSEDIENQLASESGLKALAGDADMREVERMASQGDQDAQLAIAVYAYRIKKYIGAYAAAMDGVDAICFTGGIGENSPSMRRRVCDGLGFMGLRLDEDKNQAVILDNYHANQIQAYNSRIAVMVTRASEQFMIAQEVEHLLKRKLRGINGNYNIPVAVSARHVHLNERALRALFGEGYELKKMRDLVQPGTWAAEETVDLIGPKGEICGVRILGPLRDKTQIEVSKTDTYRLGVNAPVRASGKLEGTPEIRLRGPKGEFLTAGLIVAARHIHMHTRDAQAFGLKDGDIVDVKLNANERGVSFANTLIRVSDDFATEMHIDTDEANAANISHSSEGELILNDNRRSAGIVSRQNTALKMPF